MKRKQKKEKYRVAAVYRGDFGFTKILLTHKEVKRARKRFTRELRKK